MKIYYFILKLLRRIYSVFFLNKKINYKLGPNVISDADMASKKIYDLLVSNKPCMITRFGSTEAGILSNYIGINSNYRSILDFIRCKCPPWWWEKSRTRYFNL